jgi:sugar O-acyltransferase (sialic acid O-acetyltransferase NeuD family)
MPTERLSLIGAGGHAKVVLEAARAAHPGIVLLVFDQSPADAGRQLLGIAVERMPEKLSGAVHIAIGDNAARERVGQPVPGLFTVIHPAAAISPTARVGEGVFAAALCVIGPEATVGRGVIVNHGAIVDHDCAVGDWTHIAPNATLGGGVTVGRNVMVGAGATILPGVRVGDHVTIGAGAVVLADVATGTTVVGVHKETGKA